MVGVSNNRFDINGKVNRAMVVTTLWAMEGKPNPKGSKTFSDITNGKYYSKAVKWAAENGIVAGYTNGQFKPLQTISRQQLVAILYKAAQYNGLATKVTGTLNKYNDASSIARYAVTPMKWAIGHGLVTGRTTTTLAPKGELTRAELATVLMQFDTRIR